jgi:hypothetical protein
MEQVLEKMFFLSLLVFLISVLERGITIHISMTYEEFLKCDGPKPSHGNESAKKVWDFLGKPENVAKMIAMAAIGQPALLACAADVEKLSTPEFDMVEEKHPKQVVGHMVQEILRIFEYVKNSSKGFPEQELLFRNASTYIRGDIEEQKE